jgi:hypothetical protein
MTNRRATTQLVSLHREQAAELAMLTEALHRWLADASSSTRAKLAAFLGGAAGGTLAVAGLVDLLDLATARLRRRLPEQGVSR